MKEVESVEKKKKDEYISLTPRTQAQLVMPSPDVEEDEEKDEEEKSSSRRRIMSRTRKMRRGRMSRWQ